MIQKIISTICLLACTNGLALAQQSKSVEYKGETIWGEVTSSTKTISVDRFKALLTSPISIKDKRDQSVLQPVSFSMTYAERGIYEDEAGKPMIVADYVTRNFRKTIDSSFITDLSFRAKEGDTAFIDHIEFINLQNKDKHGVKSTPIKVIITK